MEQWLLGNLFFTELVFMIFLGWWLTSSYYHTFALKKVMPNDKLNMHGWHITPIHASIHPHSLSLVQAALKQQQQFYCIPFKNILMCHP
jgi:hypothetical protein